MGRFHFEFQNLCGNAHGSGPVRFVGGRGRLSDRLVSATGGRLTLFDIAAGNTRTLPFESSQAAIVALAVSPKTGRFALVADETRPHARLFLINLEKRIVLHRFTIKAAVRPTALKFSPCEKYFAVGAGRRLEIWKVPPAVVPEFAPFEKVADHTHHAEDILVLDWAPDSSMIATGSSDLTARIYSLHAKPGVRIVPLTLSGHRDHVNFVAFVGRRGLLTSARDGVMYCWRIRPLGKIFDSDPGDIEAEVVDNVDGTAERDIKQRTVLCAEARVSSKHFIKHSNAKAVHSACFHFETGLFVAGLSNGVFAIYELPLDMTLEDQQRDQELFEMSRKDISHELIPLNLIHAISVSSKAITSVDMNSTGEWLALGSSVAGQLIVWEWRSETHVLKQQGHLAEPTSMSFSPDGQQVATGGGDGRVKLWSTGSGFCITTFKDHTAPVTSVAFSVKSVVLSASLDGTVRAYDTKRYRCFRVLVAPPPARQFISVAVDQAGDLVAAGCQDTFEVLVWSLRTGRIMEVLNGHTGPVPSLAFHPVRGTLASISWDGNMRLWDVYSGSGGCEIMSHSKEAVAVSFRPDGREIAVATTNGEIVIWDADKAAVLGTINGRRDAAGGRNRDSRTVAPTSGHFTTLCYSADGRFLLAGGESKYVCIYNATDGRALSLVERYEVSRNRAFDGIVDKLSTKDLAESGVDASLIQDYDSEDDDYADLMREDALSLPGVKVPSRGTASKRRKVLRARTRSVGFSPTGRVWGAVSSEGLLLYSADVDSSILFDPSNLQIDVTPESALAASKSDDHIQATRVALRLNQRELLTKILEAVPYARIGEVVQALSLVHFESLLAHVAWRLEASAHLEFDLKWAGSILNLHGAEAVSAIGGISLTSSLRSLQRAVSTQWDRLSRLCDDNSHSLDYLISLSGRAEVE